MLNWKRRKLARTHPERPKHLRKGKSSITVGRFTYGFDPASVREWGEGSALTIGSFCSIADSLTVMLGGNHRVDWVTTFPFGHIFQDQLGGEGIKGHPQSRGDVVIGHDVWIGSKVTILSGVTIGDGAVIAANATVTRSVGAYEVWAGNPARRIATRFAPEIVEALKALQWWTLDLAVIRQIAPLLSQAPTPEGLAEIRAIAGR